MPAMEVGEGLRVLSSKLRIGAIHQGLQRRGAAWVVNAFELTNIHTSEVAGR